MAKITRTWQQQADGRSDTTTTRYSFWGELILLAVVLGWSVLIFAASRQPDRLAGDTPTAQLHSRAFAALQVYRAATQDDWLQRAAIAQATLNAFPAGGTASFSPWRDATAAGTFDPIRWQNALDAVDAVSSGDYPLPTACTRASSVVSSTAAARSGTQCVVGDLAFVEQPW